MSYAFPTVAQMAVQAHLTRTSGSPQSLPEITQFADRARVLEPRLTDRGAMVLYVTAKCTDATVKDLEVAIQAKPGVIYAVLRGLHDLGLIEVRNAGWTKTASLTNAGKELVRVARQSEPSAANDDDQTDGGQQII
jgi:hypothetical protein